jgi:hypothetical protein
MNDGRCSDQLGFLTKRTAPASREAVVRVTTNTNPPLQTSIHRTLDGWVALGERADVLTPLGFLFHGTRRAQRRIAWGHGTVISRSSSWSEARMAASTGPRSGLQALTAGGANCVPWEPSRSCPQPTTGPREGWRGMRPAGAPPHHRPSDVDPLWSTSAQPVEPDHT